MARTRLASPELRPPFLPTAVLAAVYLATTILTWYRTLIGDEILYFLNAGRPCPNSSRRFDSI